MAGGVVEVSPECLEMFLEGSAIPETTERGTALMISDAALNINHAVLVIVRTWK